MPVSYSVYNIICVCGFRLLTPQVSQVRSLVTFFENSIIILLRVKVFSFQTHFVQLTKVFARPTATGIQTQPSPVNSTIIKQWYSIVKWDSSH